MSTDPNKQQSAQILIVEDDPINLILLRTILIKAGFNVDVALNGQETLDKLETMTPDLILLDILMPVMDGFETCKRLKGSARTRDIPVIFITAKGDVSDVIKGFNLGIVDCLIKPYVPELLLARVKTHLTIQEKTRQLIEREKVLQQKTDLVQLLHQTATSANMTDDIHCAIKQHLRAICDYKHWPLGHAYLPSAESPDTLVDSGIWYNEESSRYIPLQQAAETIGITRGKGVYGKVLATGKLFWSTDLRKDSSYLMRKQLDDTGLKSLLAVPVLVGSSVVAVLAFYSLDVEKMDKSLMLALEDMGTQLGRVFERTQAREQIQYLANSDALTGLPSLRLARDRLGHALTMARRNDNKVALLFIDLDGFKSVNDTFGHDAGDEVLKQVAVKLASCIRDADTVARIGGDEFLVILPEVVDEAGAAVVAQKILEVFDSPFRWQKHAPTLGASIGIALYPDHGTSEDELRTKADRAMYRVKQQGKNNFCFAE